MYIIYIDLYCISIFVQFCSYVFQFPLGQQPSSFSNDAMKSPVLQPALWISSGFRRVDLAAEGMPKGTILQDT